MMVNKNEIHPFFNMPLSDKKIVFWTAEHSHQRFSSRLREQAAFNTDEAYLLTAANSMVREQIGNFPYEEVGSEGEWQDQEDLAARESSMRRLAEDFFDSLKETASYSWGLAIVGIFHLWERDTRRAIAALAPGPVPRLESAKFNELCVQVKRSGFPICASAAFHDLQIGQLICNATKHGTGAATRKLQALCPELFVTSRGSTDLRVGLPEFEKCAAAIALIWHEYAGAVSHLAPSRGATA